MRLVDADGYGVELLVTGYQFPDAEDPRKRYSWHMVKGSAWCPEGAWSFRFPALTCDDSPHVGVWLPGAARFGREGGDGPGTLEFTEPNLSMNVGGCSSGLVELDIGLDLEFSPPWAYRRRAGTPFVVRSRLSPQQIEDSVDEWEREIALYPDGRV